MPHEQKQLCSSGTTAGNWSQIVIQYAPKGKGKQVLKSFWGDFLCNERTKDVLDYVCAVTINHLCCPSGHHPRLKETRFQN